MPNTLEINGSIPNIHIGETQVGKSVAARCIRRFGQRTGDLHTTTYTSVKEMSLVVTQDELDAAIPRFNQMLEANPAYQSPFAKKVDSVSLNPSWNAVGWQAYDELTIGGKKTVDDIRERLGYPSHSTDGKKFIFLDMRSAEVAGQSDFDKMLTRYISVNAGEIFDFGLVVGVVIDTTDRSTVPAGLAKNSLIRTGLERGMGDGTYDELLGNGKLIHFIYENKKDLPSQVTDEDRTMLKKTLKTPYYAQVSFKTDAHDKIMDSLLAYPIIAYNNNARIGGWM
jgi:hypothetical protein